MPQNSQIKLAIQKLKQSQEQPIESMVKEFELNQRVSQLEELFKNQQEEILRQANQNEMLKYQKMKVTEMYDRRMKKIESLLVEMIHRQQGGGLNRSYIATGSDLDQITEATNIKL